MSLEDCIHDFQVLVSSCEGTSHVIAFIKKSQQWRVTLSQHYENRSPIGPQKQVSFLSPSLQQSLDAASGFIRSKRRESTVKFTIIKK